jgi:hypothetical protein
LRKNFRKNLNILKSIERHVTREINSPVTTKDEEEEEEEKINFLRQTCCTQGTN